MRLRTLTLIVVSAGFLASCDSDTPTVTEPNTPSSPAPGTTTSPSAPAANRAPGTIILDVAPRGAVLAGATSVTFGARVTDPDGDSLTYAWDFGDDTFTSSNPGVAHTFNRARDYRVKLTVTDGKGGVSTADTNVTVGSLEGNWNMATAAHENLQVKMSHNNNRAINGIVSNGMTFSGNVTDPYNVRMCFDGASYCVQAGCYNGTTDAGLNQIIFPGGGCRGFQLNR